MAIRGGMCPQAMISASIFVPVLGAGGEVPAEVAFCLELLGEGCGGDCGDGVVAAVVVSAGAARELVDDVLERGFEGVWRGEGAVWWQDIAPGVARPGGGGAVWLGDANAVAYVPRYV